LCFEDEDEEEEEEEKGASSFPFDLLSPTTFLCLRFLGGEEEEGGSMFELGWMKSMVRRGRSKP